MCCNYENVPAASSWSISFSTAASSSSSTSIEHPLFNGLVLSVTQRKDVEYISDVTVVGDKAVSVLNDSLILSIVAETG